MQIGRKNRSRSRNISISKRRMRMRRMGWVETSRSKVQQVLHGQRHGGEGCSVHKEGERPVTVAGVSAGSQSGEGACVRALGDRRRQTTSFACVGHREVELLARFGLVEANLPRIILLSAGDAS
eukprot:746987-Hanusia_phi.AAC.4